MKRMKGNVATRFVLCINNEGSPVDLEVGKVYRVLPDRKAKSLNLLRVIDESGGDYLYPADQFVPVRLPATAKQVLLQS